MKEENIRSLHIPIHYNLSTKEKRLIINTALEAAQAYSILSELAKETGECCHFTLLGELGGMELLENLHFLNKKLIYPIARRACRHLYAERSTGFSYPDGVLGFPVRDNVLKFCGEFVKLALPAETIVCKFNYPYEFAKKYKFNIRDYLFADVLIEDVLNKQSEKYEKISLRMGYSVEEAQSAYPLFELSKREHRLPSLG